MDARLGWGGQKAMGSRTTDAHGCRGGENQRHFAQTIGNPG